MDDDGGGCVPAAFATKGSWNLRSSRVVRPPGTPELPRAARAPESIDVVRLAKLDLVTVVTDDVSISMTVSSPTYASTRAPASEVNPIGRSGAGASSESPSRRTGDSYSKRKDWWRTKQRRCQCLPTPLPPWSAWLGANTSSGPVEMDSKNELYVGPSDLSPSVSMMLPPLRSSDLPPRSGGKNTAISSSGHAAMTAGSVQVSYAGPEDGRGDFSGRVGVETSPSL